MQVDFQLSMFFSSEEKSDRATTVYECIKNGLSFGIVTKRRIVFFDPVKLISAISDREVTFTFSSLEAMMVEIAGLLFIAKDILIPNEMKKIKAKQTLHGSYGLLAVGETASLRDKTAKELEDKGLVEILGDDISDEEADKLAKTSSDKGSFKITDNSGENKKKATVSDDVVSKEEATDPTKETKVTPPAATKEDKKPKK